MNTGVQLVFRKALSMVCALLVLQFGTPLFAQELPPSPEQAGPPAPALSPDQLANLVAPIALYPDSLLSQVLVAATYPLEIVEAGQWLQQNRNLRGAQLVEAARQQNWDASIQALVVFPDVMDRLCSNIRWTTDLGNAFLAQQADVMDAVQQMRARARAAGRLNSNPQETVTTQTQGGQTAIEIQPANPQVIYVPTYNPEYIWGPPVYGYYPPLYYPQVSFGFGFGPGIFIDAFFGGIGAFFGGLGWGGWGWGLGWFGHSIFLNNGFFNHYGYSGFRGGGSFQGRGSWAHDPGHRLGVPYSNRAVASRFSGASSGRGFSAQSYAASRQASPSRMNSGGNFGNRGSMGTNSAAPRSLSQQGAGSRGGASPQTNSAQGWQRFSGPGSGTGQAAASNGRGGGTASGYRSSSPAYSTNGGYRSSSSYAGGAGSYGGGRAESNYRSSSSGSRGGNSSRSGGGGASSHSSGGGSHGGGGGHSSHSSGGGHHR